MVNEMEELDNTDFAFIREGAPPLACEPLIGRLVLLQSKEVGAWECPVELDNRVGVEANLTLTAGDCQQIATYLIQHSYKLLRHSDVDQFRSVRDSIRWFRSCNEPHELIHIQELPIEQLN